MLGDESFCCYTLSRRLLALLSEISLRAFALVSLEFEGIKRRFLIIEPPLTVPCGENTLGYYFTISVGPFESS